jgi:outer membrane lipoprotein SlyB
MRFRPFTLLTLAAWALLTAGCTSKPIVDTKGVDQAQYRQDDAECAQLAEQANVGGKAAGNAAAAGVVGGLLGAIFGNSTSVARGAGTGAVVGAGKGALEGNDEKETVYKRCMINRGYAVLN